MSKLGSLLHGTVFFKKNLVPKKSKKKVVSKSRAESIAMASVTCEFIWIQDRLVKMGHMSKTPKKARYDNWFAIYIAQKCVLWEDEA